MLNLVDNDSLQPTVILSELFSSGLEKETVHIIIYCSCKKVVMGGG
jgi:hypothetical protein